MKVLCVFGQHNYGEPARGLGYEYSNFIPALKNLGHEVLFFESLNKSKYADYADMNWQLLQIVEAEKPDLIFCELVKPAKKYRFTKLKCSSFFYHSVLSVVASSLTVSEKIKVLIKLLRVVISMFLFHEVKRMFR